MKVIISDNFCRDYISDRPYRQNLTEKEAKDMAIDKNREDPEGAEYYRAVPDNHELFECKP
jgi:hypothetical protein